MMSLKVTRIQLAVRDESSLSTRNLRANTAQPNLSRDLKDISFTLILILHSPVHHIILLLFQFLLLVICFSHNNRKFLEL
jgi:hypothetical protein